MSEVTVDRFYMASDYGWMEDVVGDLVIRKVVSGGGSDKFSFTVTLDDTGYTAENVAELTDSDGSVETLSLAFTDGVSESFSLGDGQSLVIRALPVVGYSASEEPQENWETTSTGSTGEITVDGVECEFVNTYVAPEPKSGTVVINGDLTTDLAVDGNIQVSGAITGNAVATGTITYGSLTGSISQGAEVSSPCLTVSNGTLTFDAGVSKSGSALYTEGTVTNGSGTTTVVNCDLTIETGSRYALDNFSGTMTVSNGVTVKSTSTDSSGSGVYNYRGTFTVSGTLNATGGHCGVSGDLATFTITEGATVTAEGTGSGDVYGVDNVVSSTFMVSGTLNAIGVKYGVENSSGTFTISEGATVTAEGTASADSYGVYNIDTGIFTVSGTLNATGGDYGVYDAFSTFTITEGATVTAEGTYPSDSCGVASLGSSTFTVSGTLNATGGGYGLNNADSFATSTIESTATAVLTGGSYAIYNNGGHCRVKSGAKVTYNGGIYGVTYG